MLPSSVTAPQSSISVSVAAWLQCYITHAELLFISLVQQTAWELCEGTEGVQEGVWKTVSEPVCECVIGKLCEIKEIKEIFLLAKKRQPFPGIVPHSS